MMSGASLSRRRHFRDGSGWVLQGGSAFSMMPDDSAGRCDVPVIFAASQKYQLDTGTIWLSEN
jgi:hypothetical protein